MFDSYDPNTCCGGAAYGVDPELMNITNQPLYHIDIGRVFNNPKNKIYSNRIDRTYNDLTVESQVPSGTPRQDYTYIAVNENGNGLLVESGALYEVDLACTTGVWDYNADYIYKLNGEYSLSSGVGAEGFSTESGFYPLFPRQLPYFGRFDDADRWDNTVRQLERGNREKNKNATCYTKKGSLTVYPDCLSQWTAYQDCGGSLKYTLNNVPRLGLVYKGCDFNDPCTFDDSGRPWTAGASGHPSGLNDLIRGFGGQEIQMYVNLGTARGVEIKRDPCSCGGDSPGTLVPEFVEIPSPVSYPCFPKFDLYPDKYGCQDPLYYLHIMDRLGLDTDPSGGCATPYYDACDPIQPYTTYGVIRNLCGKETNSRRGVIDSLSDKLHTGDYDDLSYTNNTVEPMYVAFEQDVPDCCSPTGFPVGGPDCDPGLSTQTYGSGAQAELVTDLNGNVSFNIIDSGTGYLFGGAATFTSTLLTPTPSAEDGTLLLEFNGPGNSLDNIVHPSTGNPPATTFPLTINPGASGAMGSGGFTYDDCSPTGFVHYWGLTDTQGRLAYPYFRTQPAEAFVCGVSQGPYVDYSDSGTITKDWPKSGVPFLVEIDHEEYCSSCSVTQMPTGNLNLQVNSLKTEYSHGDTSETNDTRYSLYGWNHCQYPGNAITPPYDELTDSWNSGDFCQSGDGLGYLYGQPYTGETCECGDGFSATMVPRVLKGTDVPIGYITSGRPVNSGINSYLPFNNCGVDFFGLPPDIINPYTEVANDVLDDHIVYIKASLSCSNQLYGSEWLTSDTFSANGLEDIYGCGGCATSFPAPNSAPDLDVDFWFVRKEYEELFKNLDDKQIYNETDFITNGLQVSNVPTGVGNNQSITINLSACDNSKIHLYGCTVYKTKQTDLWAGGFVNRTDPTFSTPVTCLGFLANPGDGIGPNWEYSSDFQGSGDFTCNDGSINTYTTWDIAGDTRRFTPGTGILLRDLRTTPQLAFDSYYLPSGAPGTDGGQLAAELLYDCIDCEECGTEYAGSTRFPNKPKNREWLTCAGCFCQDFDDDFSDGNALEIYEATYSVASGWRVDVDFSGLPQILWWSGENLPGVGNIGPLLLNESIAIKYDDTTSLDQMVTDGPSTTILSEPFCNYHTGPNRYANIGAELFEPFRSDVNRTQDVLYWEEAGNLVPVSCESGRAFESQNRNSPFYSTCGTPVPFDTHAGGIGTGIQVNKKACWPEVMTVHKIECVSINASESGYKLHVSREYFEHDRNWYKPVFVSPIGYVAVNRLGLIEGGEDSTKYSGSPCPTTYPVSCADPGGSPIATTGADFALPMMTISDKMTPVYPDVCATGTEPFETTDSSFDTRGFGSHTTSEEHPSGCLYYPNVSGDIFWNFYNLLYDLNDPTADYLSDAGGGVYEQPIDPDPAVCDDNFPFNLVSISGDLDPAFNSVSQMKFAHSCVQDTVECGGAIWCNKEFFPRQPYAVNTRITKFAALSICEQNAEFEKPVWYEGHENTWDDSPNKTMLATGPFIDACDTDASVLLASGIGIDDNVLYIPLKNEADTSTSIETLMGIIHPGFKSNFNEKTCIYAKSGECLDYLPEHNQRSINDITFTPDEYGYYLDDLVTSGTDNCLFTPFKIMVDVECCPDRIGHKGTSDPTNLNYMVRTPATVCQGWIADPSCNCSDGNTTPEDSCQAYDKHYNLPGLTGLNLLVVYDVTSGVCYTGCAADTGEYLALTSGTYWSQPTPVPRYIVDPFLNNPPRLLNLIDPNGAVSSDISPCEEVCAVPSGYDTIEYNYVNIDSTEAIYEKDGVYFTSGYTSCLDFFSYSGDIYRFCGNIDSGPFQNCCGDNAGVTASGCGCNWNVCSDYPEAIKIMDSGIDPSGWCVLEGDITGETCVNSGVAYSGFFPGLDCQSFVNIRSCPYPSNLLFNITEDI